MVSIGELNCYPPIGWQQNIEEFFWGRPEIESGLSKLNKRLTPLGAHLYDLAVHIGKIIGEIFSGGSNVVGSVYKIVGKVQILAIVFIPLKVYNIVSIWRSDHTIASKCVDTSIEVGGMISIGATVVNWVTHNFHNLSAVVPYLVGVSIIFGVVDVYKKSCALIEIKKIASEVLREDRFNDLYQKILDDQLDDSEKTMLKESFLVKDLEKFREQAKTADKEKVRENLEKRVKRTINSSRVALAASVIDVVASAIILAVLFVAPEIAVPLSILNASLLGSSSIMRIVMHFFDWKTENFDIEQPQQVELQPINPEIVEEVL